MKDLMSAAVVYGQGDVRVEKFEIPDIKDNEVLVKIMYAAICPSDMRYYLGTKKAKNPIILGHEASGVVVAVGSKVSGISTGDKVVVNSDYKCGKC